MADTFTNEKRSKIMSQVRSKNTKPEILLRKWLHSEGFRFRIHKKNLPGKPDIILPKYKVAINVHGCFWHRHNDCKNSTRPKSNVSYWEIKFNANVERDKKNTADLMTMGWKVITIWECEVNNGSFKDKFKMELFYHLKKL